MLKSSEASIKGALQRARATLDTRLPAGRERAPLPGVPLRLVTTRANGQPAFGCYLPDPQAAIAHAYGLLVLTLKGDRISAITWFFDRGLFPNFGSPGRFTSEEAAQHRRGVVEHLGRWRLGLAPVHGVVAHAAHEARPAHTVCPIEGRECHARRR